MKKVIIIGPAGAGKTTLATAMSKKLSIRHVELDSINHQENWQQIDKDKFRAIVKDISAGDSWIFCGNYFSTLGLEFWKKADTIIWCDYSFPLVLGRLLRRTIRRASTKETLWNGNTETIRANFFSKDSVIRYMISAWNKQKKRYEPFFSNPDTLPGIELVRLKSPRAADDFLKNIK